MSNSLNALWNLIDEQYLLRQFESLTITGPKSADNQLPRRYALRLIELKQGEAVQWTAYDQKRRQTHQNHSWEETLELLQQRIGKHYRSAHLRTTREDIQIRITKKGKLQLNRAERETDENTSAPVQSHNVSKDYLFPEGKRSPFLIETGIMTEQGQVRKSKYQKFRQINRFAEFVADCQDQFPTDRPVRIVDYGCGKSYLTFAVRELLVEKLGFQVEMLGLDNNPEVIQSCRQTAANLEWDDIRFEVSSITAANLEAPLDLAIWLHACDTATDEALAQSLNAKAAVILAVPCCQHELHHQLENETLAPLLKHGILRERLASLSTDALRGSLLEANGYRTQLMEFIDLEHTAKNVLIRAIKTDTDEAVRQKAFREYQQLKQLLSVKQFSLESLLAAKR